MNMSASTLPPVPVRAESAPEKRPNHEEKAALAEVRAAGARAAAWLRSLYFKQKRDGLLKLAAAVEEAVTSLDLNDHDTADGFGDGGVPDELRDRLDPSWMLHNDDHLTPAQRVAILAVTACISNAAHLISINHFGAKDLRRAREVVDHAIDAAGA
jgi:hypothetical protein